ncbi:cation/H(+) antiporter [Bacteroidales bacterium]|nr:cation/H(+) antiporter [Bacteroidales bacterium]
MYGITELGKGFETSFEVPAKVETEKNYLQQGFSMFIKVLDENLHSPLGILLLQVIAILFTARVFGYIFVKLGQPSVIGEIVAGIVLGPSVLAHVFPEVSSFLFSPESLGNINILSQIGLILFMFVIGMELDIEEVKKKLKETIFISHASMIVPFILGMLAAYFTYPYYASHTSPFLSYALFIGVAMSITAFPVLARIIQEKNLSKSHVGTISLASAANNDLTAWCLLAVVIAIAQSGTFIGAIYVILSAILFVVFMFFVIKPFLNTIGNVYYNAEVINKSIVAFMLFILMVSAYITEIIGVHALFGSFIAGVVMPSNIKFRKIITEKVEDVALCLFLPLFFVSTGLKTEIGLINTPTEWLVCLMFIVVAVIGKIGGASLSARFVGESWKDSWTIGALMNTRGLMELIVLTIGYEMGILSPSIFVMLVLMTLVTTFMTGPLMNFIDYCYRKKTKSTDSPHSKESHLFRLLLSFGRANSGGIMLHMAHQVLSKGRDSMDITALHLTVGAEINPIHTDNFESISFEPILEEAKKLNVPLKTLYRVSNNASEDIVGMVNEGNFDFLLVGAGIAQSDLPSRSWFYPGDLLKDKTKSFIEEANCTVGVFMNRNFEKADHVLLVLDNVSDTFLIQYAENLMQSNNAKISFIDIAQDINQSKEILKAIAPFLSKHPYCNFIQEKKLSGHIFQNHNFMLIAYKTWNEISERSKDAFQYIPSTLIVNCKK